MGPVLSISIETVAERRDKLRQLPSDKTGDVEAVSVFSVEALPKRDFECLEKVSSEREGLICISSAITASLITCCSQVKA